MKHNKPGPLILGQGFVGTALSNYFSRSELQYIAQNRASLDYTDKDTLYNFLKDKKDKISYIISCFGYTGSPNVDACETNKQDCWNWNVNYPLNLLKVADSLKIPVVHVGSGCIFTGYEREYSETDQPNFGIFSNDSSFYSKCKHELELLAQDYCVYMMRIRIPFCDQVVPKNYFTKLLKYDNLIDNLNSVTSLADFCEFMFKFNFLIRDLNGGIYNVVNPQPVKTEQTLELFKKYGLENPNWNLIKDTELKTIAKRSNCVLSSDLISSYNLQLPPTLESLERDVKMFAINYSPFKR
jgi:UDP-glucose 4,6-dehydratase